MKFLNNILYCISFSAPSPKCAHAKYLLFFFSTFLLHVFILKNILDAFHSVQEIVPDSRNMDRERYEDSWQTLALVN